MPLIELVNNLANFPYYYGGTGNFIQKKIPFGSDQPGGLSSGEPYIQFPLPENAAPTTRDYYRNNISGLDFPMRGSTLDYLAQGIVVPKAAEYDTRRINKFLKSNPKGYTFIAKQVGLQLTNPKMEVGTQANINAEDTNLRFFGVLENTRIYNKGANTLTQIKLSGTGIHVDRHGLVPYNPPSTLYERVVTAANRIPPPGGVAGDNNRLVSLLKSKIYEQPRTLEARGNLLRLGIPRNQNILFQYTGGPGSSYGLGQTTIPRFYNNNGLYQRNGVAPLYDPILPSDIDPATGAAAIKGTSLQNILQGVNNTGTTPLSRRPGYFGTEVLNQQEPQNNRLVILQKQVFGLKLTLQSPIYGQDAVRGILGSDNTFVYKYSLNGTPQEDITLQRAAYTDASTDLRVEANRSSEKTNNAKTFNYGMLYDAVSARSKGYIETDFREEINKEYRLNESPSAPTYNRQLDASVYNTTARNRRGDSTESDPVSKQLPFLTSNPPDELPEDLIQCRFEPVEYNNTSPVTTQDITLMFRAYITNLSDNSQGDYSSFRYTGRGENFYIYNGFTRGISFNLKIAAMAKEDLVPLYTKFNYLKSQLYPDYNSAGFMRSPLMKLTIGNYLYRQPGFLTNISTTIEESTPWDIDAQVPTILSLSCQFTPIHNFLPRRAFSTFDSQTKVVTSTVPNFVNYG